MKRKSLQETVRKALIKLNPTLDIATGTMLSLEKWEERTTIHLEEVKNKKVS